MNSKNQLHLQLVINQLLELDFKYNDVKVIAKKALSIILKSPISSSYLNKGIIMLADEYGENLHLVANQNVAAETVKNCSTVKLGICVCGTTALTKEIQYTNHVKCIQKTKTKEHGHFSLPILYKDKLYGVLTILVLNNYKIKKAEITTLQTITKTLALIIHKKKETKYLNFLRTKLDNSFGSQYFKLLAKFLTKELKMRYCLIGQYDAKSDLVKTMVFVDGQKVQKSFSYSLLGTPCKIVIEEGTCVYQKNTQQLFPNDLDLVKLGVESYMGRLLKNEKGISIGIITLMHDKPIKNSQEKIEVLNNFLPRLISECDRKNYEDQLIINEAKYKDVFDKFQNLFVRASLLPNGESIITEVSSSIFRFSGYKPVEVIGKPSSIFYHSKNERDKMIKILIKQHHINDYPLTLLKKNGDLIFVQATVQLIFDKGIPSEIRVIARDVTEKRSEEIRKEISYLIAKKTQRRITNVQSISEYVYKLLDNIINTSNFYIALVNKENNTIDFPVFVDQKLKKNPFTHSSPIKNGLIEYMITNKGVYKINAEELNAIVSDNKLDYQDPIPKILISFPLKNEGVIVGVLTVKSYTNEHEYTKNDIDLLDFTATQLSNIIEKSQWQKSLIDKEKYFRSLVESSLEITGIVDEYGRINYISESVNKVLGYPAYYLIGKYFYDFIPEKYYEQSIEHFERVVIGKPYTNPFMVKVITKHNTQRIIQFTLNNQLKNTDIKGVIFNAHDITEEHQNAKELKQAQDNLTEQEKNYRTVFNNANDGIIRIDKKFKIIESNYRMTKILGYSKKELINKSIYDIILKEEIKLVKKEMTKLVKKKVSSIVFKKRSVHKNGKQLICKVFVKSVFTKEHQLDYYIAFITDVTKREEAIKRTTELEIALDKSADIIYVNKNGIITHVSEKIEMKTGYAKDEIIGQHTRLFNSGYHSKSFFATMWKTVLSGKVFNGEMRNRKKDGSFYWVFTTIIPIKNIYNEVDYFINVRNNITELKNARIDKIKDVIDAQEQEKETFAKELHDGLGQMLLASKMNLSAIKTEVEQLDDTTVDIYNNSLKLLNDAIHEARNVSHGLMSRALIQFGLSYSINDMINSIQTTHAQIKFNYKQNIDNQRFDSEIEKGLYRVLQELISNIIKHSEATSASIEIINDTNNLNIKVKDNGVGITNTILASNHSLGIGLKNIETRINYLSGSFNVNEKLKKGTEIQIIIPTTKTINV